MERVGAYKAKTHLARLLDEVSEGKEIVITRYGTPVAVLRSYDDRRRYASKAMIERLKRFRKQKLLGGLNLKSMIEEGRD